MISVAILIGVAGYRSERPVVVGMVRHGIAGLERNVSASNGEDGSGLDRQARNCWLRSASVGLGEVRRGRLGTDGAVRRVLTGAGCAWHGYAGQERFCSIWTVLACLDTDGRLGRAGLGKTRRGTVRQGDAGFTRSGLARQVGAWFGKARKRRNGTVVSGQAGESRNGMASNGRHVTAPLVSARQAEQWQVQAGLERSR